MQGNAPGALHHAHCRAAVTVALVVILFFSHEATASWEGLVAYWPLDEGSGLNTADVTGEYDATFSAVTWTDTVGPATQFANPAEIKISPWGSGKYAVFPTAGAAFEELDSAGQLTMACWMWPDNPQYYGILGHSGLRFIQHSDKNPGVGLELSTGYVHSATGRIDIDSRFYHVAVTYDASSGDARFYIDGAEAGSASLPAPARIGSDDDFWIGGSNGYVGQGDKSEYSGLIDDVRIYSRVLSPEEIQALAAGRGEFPQWSNNCKVFLNTTGSGADVSGDVTGFPVLVRLSGTDFDFAEAQNEGADLRFAKAGGVVPLPYEIEHWDAANEQAAVWVTVDTVYGANSDQYFMMYWGKSGVGDNSCGGCVFDTADAFEGVWHLGESGTGAAGEFTDATLNDNDGRGGNGDAGEVPTRIDGPIGYCQEFDSTRPDDITIPGTPSNSIGGTALTISAWANLQMTCKGCGDAANMRMIFGKGWQGWGLYHRNAPHDSSYAFYCTYGGTPSSSTNSGPDFASREWHHVTGTYDGSMLRIYVDGDSVGSTPETTPVTADNDKLFIGNYNSGANVHKWHGWIDEPRISRTVRSPAWIRLCYQNQRQSQTLVTVQSTVCEPPSITAQPQNAEVTAGDNALFRISATGTALAYQWERNTDSGWQTVSGATSATYPVESTTLDQDGDRFQCVVSNGCGTRTSEPCTLTVNAACVPVSITAHPRDTSVIEKSQVTLRVAADGTNPAFQWYRGTSKLADATNSTCTFTAYRRFDGASYTCEVTGECGGPVVSNPAVLNVQDTTRPNPTTALTLNASGPNDINVRWSTPETDSTDGDSVFIYYSSSGYQDHSSPDKNVLVADTVSTLADEREANAGGLSAETEYFFSVWLRDTVGNWAAGDSGRIFTGSAGTPTNPVVVRGEYVSDTRVRLTLSNVCDMESGENPFTLYADYVGVWYQSGDYVLTADTTAPNLLRFPVADLQADAECASGGTERDTVIELPVLSTPDSLYYFSVSVVWRNPDSVMAFTQGNGDSVLMHDMTPPDNPCTVSGGYPGGRSDSAFVDISGVNGIGDKVRDVVVYCSFDTTFADTFFIETFPADSVMANASADTFRVKVRNAAFDGALRSVYCAVVLISDVGVPSGVQRGEFTVGRELPENPINLSAVALSSYQVRLRWPSIAGVGADSIRIFVDSAQADVGVINVGTTLDTMFASPTDTMVTVTDLSASTLYHFAAQARIGVDWTAVTTASRAFATTDTADPSDTIPNTAAIDTAYLDTARNRIVLVWQYDSLADSSQYGIVYGVDSTAAAARQPGTWYNARMPADTAAVELGESILFDTTYTLFVHMRKLGGLVAAITPNATASVRMPSYTWQPIRYFDQTTGDTAWAFNRHVALWYPGSWAFGEFIDTVRAVTVTSAPSGLIPVSTGVLFQRGEDGPALRVAVRYDSIPPGCTAADIRLYRRTPQGQWHVYHDFSTVAGRGLVMVDERLAVVAGQTFMLMVDTRRPNAEVLSDIDTPVEPNTLLLDTVRVSDNIANVTTTLLYSRGENAASPASVDTLDGLSGDIVTEIPGGYVTADNGVRAYLVISDGLHVDTVNISRQVIVAQASDIMTDGEKWVPLRTSSILDEPDVAGMIDDASGGNGYDNTRCRLFRWFDPGAVDDSSAGTHGWVEYNSAKSPVFELQPGKLQWIKTRNDRRLDFGSGITTSLRDTFTISLPPGNWTDIALPYKFQVHVGDIIDATGGDADSLAFYRWNRGSDDIYETHVLYLPSLPVDSLGDKTRVLSPDARTGYSVYNTTATPVTLRIPPTTHVMSSYHVSRVALPKKADTHEWAVTVSPCISGGRCLGMIVLGYVPGRGGRTWYPVSPGFGKVAVGVYDRRARTVHAHAVEHGLEDGGARFELLFSNDGDAEREIRYALGGLATLPDSMQVRVVDPVDGSLVRPDDALSVTLPAKGRAYRVVSIGNAAFHAGALDAVEPFARFAAYPNPFRGSVSIRFMLPEEAARLECRLFDAQGRVVWEHTQRDGVRTGMNRLVWDGRSTNRGGVSTGMYLLRVSVFGADGRRLATREQRLVYVR